MTEDLINVAGDSARGSFFLFSGAALSTVILAISSIIISRYLGPDLYGQYTLAFVTSTLIFLFADLGIGQGIIKFTASLRLKGDTASQAKIVQHTRAINK
jgi:O-antigen/teichoic acid export membrane protein